MFLRKNGIDCCSKKSTPSAGENIFNYPFAIVTVVNQDNKNASIPILVTEVGIVIEVKRD